MNTKHLRSFSIFILSLAIIIFIGGVVMNSGYFAALSLEPVALYQFRQFCALVFLPVMGFFFLRPFMASLSTSWLILLSLPGGAGLWAFVSIIILMAGIPYSIFTGLGLCLFVIIISNFIKKASIKTLELKITNVFLITLLLSFALIISCGFVYSFVSYDSFFYFMNYGNALTITGNYRDLLGDNAYTLTNIGQFLPVLCSYMSFWKIDQAYCLQALFSIYTICLFSFSLEKIVFPIINNKIRALIFAGIFTLLLITATSYVIISSWLLANMYCLVYMFTGFIALYFYKNSLWEKNEAIFLMGLSFLSLTFIRKDGIIFAAFFFICLVSQNTGLTKTDHLRIFLPAAAAELIWLTYVRLILSASVTQAAKQSLANNKNIFFIVAIIAACFLYLYFFNSLLDALVKSINKAFINKYTVLMAGLIAMLTATYLIKGDMVIDNIDYTIRNIFLYPSAWGISGFTFGILIMLSLLNKGSSQSFFFNNDHFIWSGYCLLNLISYSLVDSKKLWVNWDDSYSRVLLQIIPVFLFIMACKIAPLLREGQADKAI